MLQASSLYIRAYSEDLRTKTVEAVESNTRASKTFGVSRSFVKRYAAAAREGEPFTAKQHPGSKPEILAAEAPENRPTYVLDRIDYLIPKRLWEDFGWSETDG